MDVKKGISRAVFVIILIASIVHLSFHFIVYGSGINGLSQTGISGLAIAKDLKYSHPNSSGLSFSIIGIEWLVLVTMIIFFVVNQKISLKTQEVSYRIKRNYNKYSTKTDLDLFYELLINYNQLNISTAAKLFNVEKENIIEWGNILESKNLAYVDYPSIGEARVMLRR